MALFNVATITVQRELLKSNMRLVSIHCKNSYLRCMYIKNVWVGILYGYPACLVMPTTSANIISKRSFSVNLLVELPQKFELLIVSLSTILYLVTYKCM